MRRYVFGTGILGAVTAGLALLRERRDGAPFTWRAALAWASWAITLALAIGAMVDTRRAADGRLAPPDSPVSGREAALLRDRLSR